MADEERVLAPWTDTECDECGQRFTATRAIGRRVPAGEVLLCPGCDGYAKGRRDGRKAGRAEAIAASCRGAAPCPSPAACGVAGRCVAGLVVEDNGFNAGELNGLRRAVNMAKGCHDYGGGHREAREVEAFHHGIETVANVLRLAVTAKEVGEGLDIQGAVVEAIGRRSEETAAEIDEAHTALDAAGALHGDRELGLSARIRMFGSHVDELRREGSHLAALCDEVHTVIGSIPGAPSEGTPAERLRSWIEGIQSGVPEVTEAPKVATLTVREAAALLQHVEGTMKVDAVRAEPPDDSIEGIGALVRAIGVLRRAGEVVVPGFEDRDVLQRAITTWGVDAQTVMAIEEFGELLTALAQFRRGRSTRDEVIDEIADAGIMVAQLAEVWGRDEVRDRIAFKVRRLRGRLPDAGDPAIVAPWTRSRPRAGFDPGGVLDDLADRKA